MIGSMEAELWTLTERELINSELGKNETLFTVANGYLGLRGDFDEPLPAFHRGTYLNGFFEKEPIEYGETAYGYAENHQTLLNLPDAKGLRLWIGAYEFQVDSEYVKEYERTLDFRTGLLTRCIRISTPAGVSVEIHSRRLVSFTHKHIAALEYTIRVLESPGDMPVEIRVESILDASQANRAFGGDPRVGSKLNGARLRLVGMEWNAASAAALCVTDRSHLGIACVVLHEFSGLEVTEEGPVDVRREDLRILHSRIIPMLPGQSTVFRRYAAYVAGSSENTKELLQKAQQEADSALKIGFTTLADEQVRYLDDFWKDADVRIEGAASIQQALRFNIFHILQSTGRDGKTSIAAKGLSGEGYEGHYFWDTEIYVCPFLTYTCPKLARQVLEYRYSILDKARERARVMNEEGALFPWRTINGEETSAYYPAGTAQYHINADIAYAIEQYALATGDADFLYKQGIEMAIETARLWSSLGHYGRDGTFRIDAVTGPDEYTAVVNNNCYTNLMARNNLRFAVRLTQELRHHDPAAFERLRIAMDLKSSEIDAWFAAAEYMYIPYDSALAIYPQDDSFLDKAEWDFQGTPATEHPLLLHYHPLVIYRHQVLKQPDLVLAQFLLSDEFTLSEKIRNYRFYESLTTGDSSLSHCIQSIMASEIGSFSSSYDYFMKTVRMDLDDIHANSRDGIHTAAMAGSWMSVVYGFAGFRDRGRLSFDPQLPQPWTSLSFTLLFRKLRLQVKFSHSEVFYRLDTKDTETGESVLEFFHRGIPVNLRPGDSKAFSLKPVLRGVLLDLDGVLTDTASYHYRAWKHLADEKGWKFDKRVNEQLKGVSRKRSLELILEHNNLTLGEYELEAVMEEKNNYYVESLKALTPKDILPGMDTLLRELGRRGIRRIVASASKNAPMILDRLGLISHEAPELSMVDGIVDPSIVALGKPDPELFLAAAAMAGCHRRDCVGIEDAQAGIDALGAAGIASIGIGKYLVGADITISSTELLTMEVLEKAID